MPPSSLNSPRVFIHQLLPVASEKGNTPLRWANDKEDPKHAQSHAPALGCLLLVQRPADTKAIRADFEANGILRARTLRQTHT